MDIQNQRAAVAVARRQMQVNEEYEDKLIVAIQTMMQRGLDCEPHWDEYQIARRQAIEARRRYDQLHRELEFRRRFQ